uniref:Tify domain-containing protein n=1 Tax=Nelumbo nucifera TaxID=4432 RepID=A0A822YTF7_NELNU|nr:TPA_asm: hypothetical protein HUJ06_008045 [Nelumbo nucifera]
MAKSTLPLAMRRSCNLDLCLFPIGSLPSNDSGSGSSSSGEPIKTPEQQQQQQAQQQQQQQQLTIFYNGRVCVCDVTEFQASSLLFLSINTKLETS